MRYKKPLRASILLVLAILLPLLVLPAHASTYIGYGSSNQGSAVCPSNCEGDGNNGAIGIGETIQAPFAGSLVAVGILTGQITPNQVVVLTFPAGTTPTSSNYSCGSAGTCTIITGGQTFTVQDVEGLSGLGASGFFTINLANPVTVANGQWVSIVYMFTGGSGNNYVMAVGAGGQAGATLDTQFTFGSTNPGIGTTASSQGGPIAGIVGGSFNPTGTSGGTVTVTQCYGNCGSPAITLANTNSTHSINFNQTITLFYQFQSNINGFLLNITTSMAKSYTNLPNGPAFGVYTIANCPLGQTPFSAQCPGTLQAQSAGQNFFSPPKGRSSFSGLRIPVANGQWVGIALSAFLSGLDVNDTNTNVNLWQTNEGKIPSSIQNPSSLGNSKVGLWAWINGNVVTGGPSTSPNSGNCGPGLDFILTCAVNSLCSVVTVQCQTGSSIFLIVVLTIFSMAVLLGIFSYWLPNLNLSTKGLGEFAILIFIGWLTAFGSFGLILPWLLILLFFVVAWIFLGRSRGTGPI